MLIIRESALQTVHMFTSRAGCVQTSIISHGEQNRCYEIGTMFGQQIDSLIIITVLFQTMSLVKRDVQAHTPCLCFARQMCIEFKSWLKS